VQASKAEVPKEKVVQASKAASANNAKAQTDGLKFTEGAHAGSRILWTPIHTPSRSDWLEGFPVLTDTEKELLKSKGFGAAKPHWKDSILTTPIVQNKPQILFTPKEEEEIMILFSSPLTEENLKDPRIKIQIDDIKKNFGEEALDKAYLRPDGAVGLPCTQNHHILHKALLNRPDVKELFDKAGFDIENPLNKILLPTKEGVKMYPDAKHTIHEGRHEVPHELIEKLKKLKQDSEEKSFTKSQLHEGIIQVLQEEKALLEEGLKNLNKNTR
jgi:hypothetical protein